ncbi:hypothetical protein BDW74DRAFT_172748 [Aspergillus multicolor]|uniref:uncharacterized protein n=1 Tax=Aspergillus multicolor TaxID=41759 RepID=UPI003CCD6595
MHALKLLTFAIFATTSQAAQINRPSVKDSTILRSTVTCVECPERSCYQCRYGAETNLRANTGGLAWIRSLVGFRLDLPEDRYPDDITKCTVQFPAFTKLPEAAFNLTVSPAVSSDWDEVTVNADNAPASTDDLTVYHVPALTNPPLLDVTNACWLAGDDGQFSIYLGAEFGSYEIWSKDSGNPAVLHIYYDD